MRVDIVRGRHYVSFLEAFFCSMAVCLLFAVVFPEDADDPNSSRGWGMDSPFIGVSVSMIQCLVVLLFFTLWMVAFTHFVSHISKFKSFSALAERSATLLKKDASDDNTVNGQHQLAKAVATQTEVDKPNTSQPEALGKMKVIGSVLHHRILTKKSLAP